MKLSFEITFASDYHIGAGYGLPPEVDSALHRDPDGAPVIRGTELAGLLRQGLFDLLQLPPLQEHRHCQASGLKNGPEYCGQWGNVDTMCPICDILGTPARPKPWLISSARPAEAQAPLEASAHWRAGETAAQITTRARINPRTRRAEHNKLFSREEGDGRLRFRFDVSSSMSEGRALDQAAWLSAAARMVRRLGAGRRRGLGECEIHVVGDDAWSGDRLLERFGQILQGEITNQTKEEQTLTAPNISSTNSTGSPYRMQIVMRLDEPLLVARRAEAGNRFESVDMLPGTLLRGALAWRIAQRFGDNLNDEAYETFLDLFFRDGVRFSFLYPVAPTKRHPRRGYLNLPAPRDLRTCELYPGFEADKGHGVWSKLRTDFPTDDVCPQCGQMHGGYKSRLESLTGFIELNKAHPLSNQSPAQSVEMHIRMEPRTGRVQSGALFSYVVLEPGQYFVGEIACTDENVWQALLAMANLPQQGVFSLRLGKATRRGYGRVSLSWRTWQAAFWRGQTIEERLQADDGDDEDSFDVILTLLSDAIVTDTWGRFVRGFDAAWIAREFKLAEDQVEVTGEQAFDRVRPVASFNALLGLPRFEDMALVAGSTVKLRISGVDAKALQEKLAAVEARGIGLRREEGFGMVAFNHPLHKPPDQWQFKRVDLVDVPLAAGGGSAQALADFLKRWEDYLDAHFSTSYYGHESFGAVARIVQVASGGKEEDLKRKLEAVGLQEQVIPAPLAGRDNISFAQSDGKAGMNELFSLLDALKNNVDAATNEGGDAIQLWKTGLEMLSERIAKPVSYAQQKEAK